MLDRPPEKYRDKPFLALIGNLLTELTRLDDKIDPHLKNAAVNWVCVLDSWSNNNWTHVRILNERFRVSHRLVSPHSTRTFLPCLDCLSSSS